MKRADSIFRFVRGSQVVPARERNRLSDYVELAAVTMVIQIIYSGLLQYRFLAFLKAVGTKPVNWVARGVIVLQDINKNSANNFFKIIARCFGIPLFICYEFFFYVSFSFGQCLVLGLSGKQLGLEINYVIQDCRDSLLGFNILDSLKRSRESFDNCGCSRPSGSDFRKHNSSTPFATSLPGTVELEENHSHPDR